MRSYRNQRRWKASHLHAAGAQGWQAGIVAGGKRDGLAGSEPDTPESRLRGTAVTGSG